MALSDVLGQDEAARCLRAAVAGERVAHAYLFRGPEGVGKTRMAVEFTRLLCCDTPRAGEPCGACRACGLIDAGTWPDLHLLQPAEGKRFINVEQVRELIGQVNLRSVEGKYKVFIVRDADDLREDAQNILLKTLEEPPAGSVLILITARPHRLLPTIHSRAQAVRFAPLAPRHVDAVLAQADEVESEARRFASHFANGSAGDALRLVAAEGAQIRDELLDRIQRLKPERAVGMGEEIYDAYFQAGGPQLETQRHVMRLLLEILAKIYRDTLVAAQRTDLPFFNEDRRTQVESIAERMGPFGAERALRRTLRGREEVDQNANMRLLLQALMSDLARAT